MIPSTQGSVRVMNAANLATSKEGCTDVTPWLKVTFIIYLYFSAEVVGLVENQLSNLLKSMKMIQRKEQRKRKSHK